MKQPQKRLCSRRLELMSCEELIARSDIVDNHPLKRQKTLLQYGLRLAP